MEPNSGKGHKSLIIKSKANTFWNTKLYVLYSEQKKLCIDIIITEYIHIGAKCDSILGILSINKKSGLF